MNVLSDAFLAQVIETVKHYLSTSRVVEIAANAAARKFSTRFPTYAVILDETLGSANFLGTPTGSTDPNRPNATICRWDNIEKRHVQTKKRLAVANHSIESHDVHTPGAAIAINGHYWFFGDCEPLADRPTPPWEVPE